MNDQYKPGILHTQDITTIKTLVCADISIPPATTLLQSIPQTAGTGRRQQVQGLSPHPETEASGNHKK